VSRNKTLHGVIAAIPTPVNSAGNPDHARFLSLARALLADGCDGLNVLGTTGEATSFSSEQRMRVMSVAAKGLPPDRLMVGTGAAAVADAIRLTRYAGELGFAGALLLPPFFYKGVTDEGVTTYVAAVADATAHTQIPLYLYNFPALSGVPYSPALVRKLLVFCGERIAGLKDSSGDQAYAREIAAISSQLDVFPSSEATLLEARSGVFAGCISATANLNSADCARAFITGDEAAHRKAIAIRQLLDALPLVPAIKFLLSRSRGEPELAAVVAPLSPLSVQQQTVLLARLASAPVHKSMSIR
jgi:4-hydroxy-tetrahydrodipicolinate synthase